MNPPPGPPFRLAFSGAIGDELRRLAERAAALGIGPRFAAALTEIRERLQSDPLTWGDPLYRLHNLGVVVCRRLTDRLLVEYAVHEAQRVVWLTAVLPVFGHPLSPDSPGGQ